MGSPYLFRCRNLEDLARLDLVGIVENVAIRFEDHVVLVGMAIELLGDCRQRVARLDRVALLTRTTAAIGGLLGGEGTGLYILEQRIDVFFVSAHVCAPLALLVVWPMTMPRKML